MNKPDFDLYLITDRHQTLGRSLTEVLEAALAGGIQAVQLREKDLPLRHFLSLAFEMRELTSQKSLFFINDRIDVCLTVGADGVHLRSNSIPPSAARRILGNNKMIGVSCHSFDEVSFAEAEGADFVTLGPLFFTPSKQGLRDPLDLALFQSVIEKVNVPVFALGGIRLERVQSAIEAGADGIALISAIMSAPDAKQATKNFIRQIQNVKKSR